MLAEAWIALLLLAAGAHGSLAEADSSSPILFSFVFVGCDRVLAGDVKPGNPSTANLAQLQRDFEEIPKLKPQPDMVFVVGDLVMGLTSDLDQLRSQLNAWKQVYLHSTLGHTPSIRLIAIPGNHESLVGAKGSQTSNPGAEDVWLSEMQDYIAGDNGPPAGGPDNLQTDQSQLTYSFNFKNTHFVIINTDPYGAVANVPVNWLQSDLQTAMGTAGIRHIFAIGHKPAFVPNFALSGEQSLNTNLANRDQFWDELNLAGMDAYLPAHVHVWDFSRPPSTDIPDLAHTYQVIAGNGGTKLDAGWQESGHLPYFGFTRAIVRRSGRVEIISYGRAFDPDNYLAPSPPAEYPTTIRVKHSIR